MHHYSVGVAGLTVNQLPLGSGGSTPSWCTIAEPWITARGVLLRSLLINERGRGSAVLVYHSGCNPDALRQCEFDPHRSYKLTTIMEVIMASEWQLDKEASEQENFDKYGFLSDDWEEDSAPALETDGPGSWSWDYPDPL